MRMICGFLHLGNCLADVNRLSVMAKAMVNGNLQPRINHHVDGSLALAVLDFSKPCSYEERSSNSRFSDLPKRSSGMVLAADIRLDEPATENDDEYLMALLERESINGIHRAIGDYAFAAWDAKNKSLLCARDAMGIRPFFFTYQPGNIFVFASLPSGLHASGFVKKSLDETFFINEILLNHSPVTQSLFLGVERLAPGSWLRVTPKGIDRGTHWRLDPATAGICKATPQDAATHLAELTAEAIRCRLPSRGPVATHLSGGIDSASISIIAAQALRATGQDVLGFSLVPNALNEAKQANKNPYIDAVIQQEPNIAWHPLGIDDSLAYLLPRMNPDFPLPDDPADPETRCFMQAAAQGAQVFLSGWGGDEGASFNGRGALAEALLTGHWRYLARELQALSTHSGQSRFRIAWENLAPYLLSPSALALVRKLRGKSSISTPKNELAYLQSQITQRASVPSFHFGPDGRRNRLKLLTNPGLTRRAEQWAIIGAGFGIAAAFPLLDRRIVEYAFSLPTKLFLREGLQRRLYRDAMIGILPETIRCKPTKVDSTLDLPSIAKHSEQLMKRLNDFKAHERIAYLFDLDTIENKLQSFRSLAMSGATAEEMTNNRMVIENSLALLRTFRYAAYIEQHH